MILEDQETITFVVNFIKMSLTLIKSKIKTTSNDFFPNSSLDIERALVFHFKRRALIKIFIGETVN